MLSFLCRIHLSIALLVSPVFSQETLPEIRVVSSPPTVGNDDESSLLNLGYGSDLTDFLRFSPNSVASAAPVSTFSLRGLTQQGTDVLGTRSNPSLIVLASGAPRSTVTLGVIGTPTWDAAAFTINGGPDLFGTGPVSQGGELQLEPADPVFFHQGKILMEGADFNGFHFGLTENLVLLDQKLALRMNLASEGDDGTITNTTRDDPELEAFQRDLLRTQLRWRPAGDDHTVFDLQLETERNRGNPLGMATTLPGRDFFDRETALNQKEKVPMRHHLASIRGTVDLGEGRAVEGEIAYQTTKGYQLADFDGGPFLNWFYRGGVDEKRLTGGSRFHKKMARYNYTLGFYAESSDYTQDYTGVGLSPFPSGSPFNSKVTEKTRMAAAFMNLEYLLASKIWLTGGVRLDHQQRDQASSATLAGFPRGSDHVRSQSTELLPEVGLMWREPDVDAGIKIARSYRPAGAAYAVSLGSSQAYDEEHGWEASIFADQQWHSFKTSGRLFYARIDSQQVPYLATGGVPVLDQFITNTGASTRAGAETELIWSGPGAFSAGMSGGYLFTEFRKLILDGVDRSGQSLPFAPEWNAAVHAEWNPSLGYFCQTALTWSDTSYSQVQSPSDTALEKRLLWSARIGHRWKNVEAYLFGDNLLNENFALVRQDLSGIGRGIEGKPNRPRTFGVGLSMNW